MAGLLGGAGGPGGAAGDEAGTIIEVLSRVLTQLIDLNRQQVSPQQQLITKFQSSYAPSISIFAYLERINKFAKCSPNCFIVALIYIDRLIETRNVILSQLNVHRVLITSVMLATKVFDDEFYKNSYYAKLGGVSTQEMNSLELEFLSLMNFDFFVSVETFEKYQAELAAFVAPSPSPGPSPGMNVNSSVIGHGRDGLGLSTPSPPVLLSCGLQKEQQGHMLGAIGQPSKSSQQQCGFHESSDSAVVPLTYDDNSNQFVAVTPPLHASSSTSDLCHQNAAPILSSSLSHQSYFSGQPYEQGHPQQQQQPMPPYHGRRMQGQVPSIQAPQQMGYGCGGGGAYSHAQPTQHAHGNHFSVQHRSFYPNSNGSGSGRYVTPVTTPTSVTEAVFSWGGDGSGSNGCGVNVNSSACMPYAQQSHLKQQSHPQPTLLFPANFYHPAVGHPVYPPDDQQRWQQPQQHHYPSHGPSSSFFHGGPQHHPLAGGQQQQPYYHHPHQTYEHRPPMNSYATAQSVGGSGRCFWMGTS